MCEPTTIMAAVSIASAAFAAKSQIDQGNYQKGVSRYNARVAENQAQEVRRAGTEAENIQRRKTTLLLAKQRAQLGAAGVELGSGSALQLQEDTRTLGEIDALRIRSNVDSQVNSLQTGAELTLSQGDTAASVGRTAATGSLLSGTAAVIGTGVADKWYTPNSSANMIQGQTGYTGGVQGVLSGNEFVNF